jgi:hypothetical protein
MQLKVVQDSDPYRIKTLSTSMEKKLDLAWKDKALLILHQWINFHQQLSKTSHMRECISKELKDDLQS